MKFISFASSSKGNCAYISYKDTNILVDCGISKKRIESNLERYGKKLKDIDAIFITHSHDDHIMALPTILKDNNMKIVSQRETLMAIRDYCESKGTIVKDDNFKIARPVNADDKDAFLTLKDIKVYPIKGTHDVPSLYYKFLLGDDMIGILTDMGLYTDYTIRSLSDVNYLMLECNYDAQKLLDNDKYNSYLKARIMGSGGHLSNVDCSEMIMKLASKTLKEVYLSHISDETNSEDYALDFVNEYLRDNYSGKIKLPKINISKRVDYTEIINEV